MSFTKTQCESEIASQCKGMMENAPDLFNYYGYKSLEDCKKDIDRRTPLKCRKAMGLSKPHLQDYCKVFFEAFDKDYHGYNSIDDCLKDTNNGNNPLNLASFECAQKHANDPLMYSECWQKHPDNSMLIKLPDTQSKTVDYKKISIIVACLVTVILLLVLAAHFFRKIKKSA
ncbi:hypothetical protein TetV_057 [Tetraselmis virus 1]|uniref:Uncharacterized protein n=1 Tax=Tetraselmis virus 1 TaxID=2060617 RepID=A0A2P0VN29_9VIRU|nr:hypothetical protein QJ968_gp057 [Tetraselmis virus 1]AUF82149.1 hypothetical protein TetV_057 [Tetraselmis virus 1]